MSTGLHCNVQITIETSNRECTVCVLYVEEGAGGVVPCRCAVVMSFGSAVCHSAPEWLLLCVLCKLVICSCTPEYTNTHGSVNVLQGKCSEAAEAISAQVSTWSGSGGDGRGLMVVGVGVK